MKKTFLAIVILFSTVLTMVNCSSNEEQISNTMINTKNEDDEPIKIGYENESGKYILYTENLEYIKEQWDTAFDVSITEFAIVEKTVIPENGEVAYLLVGTDKNIDQSIGMIISKTGLTFQAKGLQTNSISCSGCRIGCNLQIHREGTNINGTCGNPCDTCMKIESVTTTTKKK